MGAFDDLIQQAPARDKAAVTDDPFLDLVPQKREVPAGEAYSRGVFKSLGEFGKFAGQIPAAASIPFDYLATLLGAQPGSITDAVSGALVDPAQRNIEYGRLRPDEKLDVPGTMAYGLGNLIGMGPEIMAGGPGRASMSRLMATAPARVAPTTAAAVTRAALPEVALSVPSAAVRGTSRAEDLAAQGVSPTDAGIAGAITSAMTPLGFALPAAAPGGIFTRLATGGVSNIVQNEAQTSAENLVLPENARGEMFGSGDVTAGVLGAVMGAVGGGRGPRVQTPGEIQGFRDQAAARDAQAQEQAAGYERYRAILEANGVGPEDPRAARLIAMLDARAQAQAEAEAAAAAARSPQEQELQPQQPGTIVVDSQGRAKEQRTMETPRGRVVSTPGGTEVGVLSAAGTAAKGDTQARQSFGLAESQAGAKQDAVDMNSMTGERRDLRDASAGGTTTPEGSAATTPETFTFLDVARNQKGNVTGTGPQVEITAEGLTIKKNGQDVPAVEIAYEGPDGQQIVAIVEQSRVESLSRPANPRFAQDVAAQSYSPPRGTGTGAQQPSPRDAAQRITTVPGPDYIPADRAAPAGEAPRQPDTVDGQGSRVADPAEPPLLEDRRNQLGDNGERTILLTTEPLKVGEDTGAIPPERRLPGPDTPRADGQMVAGEDGTRPQTYGDSQRAPGEPYIAPRRETPIVGGEKVPGESAPFVQEREKTGQAQADRLRDGIAKLEALRDRILERPAFRRTAVDNVRLKKIERDIADRTAQMRRLIESGAAERPIATPAPTQASARPPLEVVRSRARAPKPTDGGDEPPPPPAPPATPPRPAPDASPPAAPAPAAPRTARTRGNRGARQQANRTTTGMGLLSSIRRLGGISASQARDLLGERAHLGNRLMPGLFRANGLGIDDLAVRLAEDNWIPWSELDTVDGGASRVREMIDEEIRGNRQIRFGDEDAIGQAEFERRYEDAAAEDAAVRQNEPDDVFDTLEAHDLEPTPETIVDADLVSRALELNRDAVENLPDSIEPAEFMNAIRRIVDDAENPRGEAQGGGRDAAGEAPRQEEGGARGQGNEAPRDGGDGILEQPTERGLRDREQAQQERERRVAAEERAAEDKARADRERDSFGLTGSDRAADANPGQGDIFGNAPRKGGGTQLYAGMPLDKMAEAIQQAWGWLKRDAQKVAKNAAELMADIRSTREKLPSNRANPVNTFLRSILDSAAGTMRYKVSKYDSPTAKWIMDQFHTEAGTTRESGDTYQQAVHAHVNKTLSAVSKALGDLVTDKAAMAQVAAQIRNPGSIRRGTQIGDAAHAVGQILAGQLKYMREAGVEIGEVKGGYYPREFDAVAVAKNEQSFVDALSRAYQEAGMSQKDAEAAARELQDHIVYDGGMDTMFKPDRGAVRTPFIKGRVLGKEVDLPSHPLNRFLVSDPSVTLAVYVQRAARRAEIARRFGDRFEKWGDMTRKMIAEGSGDLIGDMRDFVALGAGLRRPGVTMTSMRVTSALRTWSTLGFLEKATLSSLTEFLVPSIRSGNVLDAARSLHATLRDLGRQVAKGTVKADELRELAEDIGLIAGNIHDNINAARFSGGEPLSLLESKVLERYFHRTGLTAWTDATRMGAASVGRAFLRRQALRAEAGGKLGTRSLVEAGIPAADAPAFSKWLASVSDGLPTAADLKAADPKLANLYRRAMRRFNSQSIMNPDPTLKPAWMSSPWGSVVGQLQSFNYAFFENVLKRQARMTKEAVVGEGYTARERASMTLAPAVTMTLMYGLAYVIGEARDQLLGDPNRRKKETESDRMLKAASRALPIAPLDPFINLFSSARYQRGAVDFFSGPALGTAGRAIDAGVGLAVNNRQTTNTQERAAAKAVYDLIIEPSMNAALTFTTGGTVGTLLSAAATQAVGAGGLREEFISSVAGKDQRAGGKKGRKEAPVM